MILIMYLVKVFTYELDPIKEKKHEGSERVKDSLV